MTGKNHSAVQQSNTNNRKKCLRAQRISPAIYIYDLCTPLLTKLAKTYSQHTVAHRKFSVSKSIKFFKTIMMRNNEKNLRYDITKILISSIP